MEKKGVISLWFLIEVVGAFLVGYMAVEVSVGLSKGTIHEKLNIAKDLAMQINTLASVPGDMYIINKDLHGYSLHFLDDKIEVFESDFDQVKGVYYFIRTSNSNFDLNLNKPNQVVISKINGEIKVSEELPLLS